MVDDIADDPDDRVPVVVRLPLLCPYNDDWVKSPRANMASARNCTCINSLDIRSAYAAAIPCTGRRSSASPTATNPCGPRLRDLVTASALRPRSTFDIKFANRRVRRRVVTVVAGRAIASLARCWLVACAAQYHDVFGTARNPMQYVWLATPQPTASHNKSTCSSSSEPHSSHLAWFTSRNCAARSWSIGSGRYTCLTSAMTSRCTNAPWASSRVTA